MIIIIVRKLNNNYFILLFFTAILLHTLHLALITRDIKANVIIIITIISCSHYHDENPGRTVR